MGRRMNIPVGLSFCCSCPAIPLRCQTAHTCGCRLELIACVSRGRGSNMQECLEM